MPIDPKMSHVIDDLLGIQRQDQPLHQQAQFEECWRAIEAAGIVEAHVIIINDGAEWCNAYSPPAKLPEQIYEQLGELTKTIMASHQWDGMNIYATWSLGRAFNPDIGRAITVSEINDQENAMLYDQYGNHRSEQE